MMALLAGMVGGLGLFVLGMWFLTENLKSLASRRLRRVALRLTGNPVAAAGWGVLAGVATQSMTGLVFIVVSILRSGLITTTTGFAIILGGGIGMTGLILLVSFDVRIVALFVLGLAGIAVVSESLSKFRPISASLLGGAMLVLGLTLLQDAAAPVAAQAWFRDVMEWSSESPLLALLVAAVLTVVVQSSSTVCVFAISLAAVGFLSVEQILMFIYGSVVGSGIITYMLSVNLTGRARQVAMYLVFQNVLICAVAIPLFYAELWFGIPGVKALILSMPFELTQQLTMAYILTAAVVLPLFVLLGPTARLFEKRWPMSPMDELSKTRFIYDRALVDVGTATMLVDLEQKHVFGIISNYFDVVRQGADIRQNRSACQSVIDEISYFLEDLHEAHPMQEVEGLNGMMSRVKLLSWLENSVGTLCEEVLVCKGRPRLKELYGIVCEGVGAAFLSVSHAMESDDEFSWAMAQRLLGDRGDLMRQTRARHVNLNPPLPQEDVARVLQLTNAVEEVFFLMSKVDTEFNPYSGAGDSGAEKQAVNA